MIKFKQILFVGLAILLLTGCNFVSNSFKSKKTTKEFLENVLHKHYNKALTYLALDRDSTRVFNKDTVKMALEKFRKAIEKDFGTELNYSFMKTEKIFSTAKDKSTPPNTTLAFIQISNKKDFGVLKVTLDDKSKKILTINLLNIKRPIPKMINFWLFGLIAICIPVFNLFVIRLIKHSDLKKKWPKYLAVIFFNVPTITYNVVSGLSFSLLSFQFLFGISFEYMGYLNTAWAFGVPLGGIYWMWKLKFKKELDVIPSAEAQVSTENTEEG